MENNKLVNITLLLFYLVIFLVVLLVLWYNWKRRWLYYYASKLEGPSSWPLIGSVHLILQSNDVFGNFLKIMETNKPVFKFWLGSDLLIFNSKPEDVEILLNTYLEKMTYVKRAADALGNGILTAPVPVWKKHKKMINPSFGINVLKSFVPVFVKYANGLVDDLKINYKNEKTDMLPKIWKCTLDVACETIADSNPEQITGQEKYIAQIMRMEEILFEWVFGISIQPKFLITMYRLLKEVKVLSSQTWEFSKKLIMLKNQTRSKMDFQQDLEDINKKRMLNLLIDQKEINGAIDDEEILAEINNLIIAGSETTAYGISFILVILGIYPEIQKRVHEELDSIFKDGEEPVTWEHVLKMEYLERVIKEMLRFFPLVPASVRHVHKTMKINSYVYPEGSTVLIPIFYLHRKPELWEDPLEFNPDRFLPEENEKRHRCTYIPFTYGPRNCIGLTYAMISMKVIAATILRHYTITSVDYKSINDIKIEIGVVLKATNGCRIILKRRTS